MFCKQKNGSLNVELAGDGNSKGQYYGAEYCPAGSYVCGINAQNEPPQGSGDDSSINHVRFHCCSVTTVGW